jgi:endo-1,4-beta-xylanase
MRIITLIFITVFLAALVMSCSRINHDSGKSLSKAYHNKFLVGTALNTPQINGDDTAATAIIKKHFNSIVAENCMKSEVIQPEQGKFDFTLSDKFVDFGVKNNMFIIGHTLVWHSQAPDWIFTDQDGNDVSRDTLIERMRTHITTVVSRYKGKVHGWDVVNEVITDEGEYRQSKWFEIIGEDYIELAFKFTTEADPEAELYYNDYSLPKPAKRDKVAKMVKNLLAKGVQIDGIGMQAHYTLDYPKIKEFEDAIVTFSNLGVKVMITELDITVLPPPTNNNSAEISQNYELLEGLNPYPNQLPDSVRLQLKNRYIDLFSVLLAYQENVSRVTLWGVTDSQSWRNYWPIKGRTDYPLLFDRNYEEKNIVKELIKLADQQSK